MTHSPGEYEVCPGRDRLRIARLNEASLSAWWKLALRLLCMLIVSWRQLHAQFLIQLADGLASVHLMKWLLEHGCVFLAPALLEHNHGEGYMHFWLECTTTVPHSNLHSCWLDVRPHILITWFWERLHVFLLCHFETVLLRWWLWPLCCGIAQNEWIPQNYTRFLSQQAFLEEHRPSWATSESGIG